MFLINPLEKILGQASKISILRFLVTTGLQSNGREIASAVGISHVKCHTALQELSQYGIIAMRRSGKSILYSLNLKNILVKKLLVPLFIKEAGLKNFLAEILSKHLKPPPKKSIILFGSFASGKARPDSDIDLLIVASKKTDIPRLQKKLNEAEIAITTGFGNHLAPIIMEAAEFKNKYKKQETFIRNVLKDGKVLSGESINELITAND